MKKIGVLLSGCGFLDGAEIHESVLTLLAIAKHKAEAVCMAPDASQAEVINHLTGKKTSEKRNILAESARIARGKILNLKEVKVSQIDALILPGGYGAAKNLSDFQSKGPSCSVHPDVERLVREIRKAGKPLGAICIAPAVLAKIFQGEALKLTIGDDPETASAIQALGQNHTLCKVNQICSDSKHQLVSTPAYMLAQNIWEAHLGIDRLVQEIMQMLS